MNGSTVPTVGGSWGKPQWVRESRGILKYQGAEKMLNCCTQTAYSSSTFFLLASLAGFCISSFKFVPLFLFLVWSQAIKKWHWYFAWTN